MPNLKFQDGREASFTERLALGRREGFQFASYTVPWGGSLLRNISLKESPMGPRNAGPPSTRTSHKNWGTTG